jgi:hypothetical protein
MAYWSKFGGLWIDDIDYSMVSARLAEIADPITRERVSQFIRDGYVIIEQAVDHAAIDAYLCEFERAAATPSMLQIEVPMAGGRQPLTWDKSLIPGSKVLDTGMLTPHGGDMCLAPKVTEFLSAVFREKALAFQTLHFEVGSTQAIHQDTAYVVVKDEPLKLVASWIALQDVKPGSGELIYYIGGHFRTIRMLAANQSTGTSKGTAIRSIMNTCAISATKRERASYRSGGSCRERAMCCSGMPTCHTAEARSSSPGHQGVLS